MIYVSRYCTVKDTCKRTPFGQVGQFPFSEKSKCYKNIYILDRAVKKLPNHSKYTLVCFCSAKNNDAAENSFQFLKETEKNHFQKFLCQIT